MAQRQQGYAATCAALRDMDLREAMRGVTNEVLVIAGRHDLSTPPAMGALIGAKLVTLEAPHMSSIEDETNFTKAVLDFLTVPEAAAPMASSGRVIGEKSPAKRFGEARPNNEKSRR